MMLYFHELGCAIGYSSGIHGLSPCLEVLAKEYKVRSEEEMEEFLEGYHYGHGVGHKLRLKKLASGTIESE